MDASNLSLCRGGKMETRKRITQQDLNTLIDKHQTWLDLGADPNKPGRLDLSKTDIAGYNISGRLAYAVFTNCDISFTTIKECVLSYVTFKQCDFRYAHLKECKFSDTTFTGCIFIGNKFLSWGDGEDYKGIVFMNCLIDNCLFKNCPIMKFRAQDSQITRCTFDNFKAFKLSVFSDTRITDTNFKQCSFTGEIRIINQPQGIISNVFFNKVAFGRLHLSNCNLSNTNFKEVLAIGSSDIINANINHSDLSQINFADNSNNNELVMQNAKFAECNLENSSMLNAKLKDCSFVGCNLKSVVLSSSEFTSTKYGSYVIASDCTKIRFSNAKIEHTKFDRSILSGGEFFNTKARRCSFEKADLTGTEFRHCELQMSNFRDAIQNENTFWGGSNVSGSIWFNGKMCSAGSVGQCIEVE
jgi:uncharacterized protein YjbI with pentapeptide repeats